MSWLRTFLQFLMNLPLCSHVQTNRTKRKIIQCALVSSIHRKVTLDITQDKYVHGKLTQGKITKGEITIFNRPGVLQTPPTLSQSVSFFLKIVKTS